MRGTTYRTYVYRTDVTPQKFQGAFYDAEGAQGWIDLQAEGAYEISNESPTARQKPVVETDAG